MVVVASSVFIVSAQRNQLYEQIDAQLMSMPLPPQARERPASDQAPVEDRTPRTDAPDGPSVDNESISDLYVAVVTTSGDIRPTIEGQLLIDLPDVQALADEQPTESVISTVDGLSGASAFRVLFLPGSDTSFAAIVAVPIDDVEDTIQRLSYTLAGTAATILLVLVLTASWVSRFGLRPISEMTDVAAAISAGERERRAEIDDESTEAGRLGMAFNVMLDERDHSETRLREFVSNASHELRTPLTSIRGYLDLYAAGGFRQPGELDDAVRRMRVEAERMNLLVEDLLVLAKFDEERPLDFSTVRIDVLARDVAALTLAAHPDRAVTVDAPAQLEVEADRLRLHQALAALVDNAVRHTPADSTIQIAAVTRDGHVELSVNDTGPGLTADEAAVVFDRFTRGDQSRARTTGGSGLGLSITRAIVQAHGGKISASATPGDGATFTIVLPSEAGSPRAG